MFCFSHLFSIPSILLVPVLTVSAPLLKTLHDCIHFRPAAQRSRSSAEISISLGGKRRGHQAPPLQACHRKTRSNEGSSSRVSQCWGSLSDSLIPESLPKFTVDLRPLSHLTAVIDEPFTGLLAVRLGSLHWFSTRHCVHYSQRTDHVVCLMWQSFWCLALFIANTTPIQNHLKPPSSIP